MSQNQRFASITGCGQGSIGEALVKEYFARGLHAIATLLPFEKSDHPDEAGITWFKLDVTSEQSIIDLKHELDILTKGYLDVLVNCAGIAYTMTAIDTDVQAVEKMFQVNVIGPMRMVHHFHGNFIRASGVIVNIGSVGGIVPYMYGSSYNATKASLHHWSNTLRLEMSPLSVRVVTIISGEVGTNILKSDNLRELPEGYFYAPLKEEFKAHVQRTVKGATDRFDYARNVVAQSLRSSPKAWLWYGGSAGIDSMFYRQFKLNKVKKAYPASSKQV
ncbi:NAD(P)-binding protein [Periconia macrospinosa]|uniref:NAD(P)-binding protein n=1 Tax=Periconia macrospinosa TaxID=97972 RepID=A0A2V1DHN6_9PLEO|nr:NAD(P)-binding protein [Periconia macrospinosa]